MYPDTRTVEGSTVDRGRGIETDGGRDMYRERSPEAAGETELLEAAELLGAALDPERTEEPWRYVWNAYDILEDIEDRDVDGRRLSEAREMLTTARDFSNDAGWSYIESVRTSLHEARERRIEARGDE